MQQFFISFSTMDISCFLKQSSPGLREVTPVKKGNCYGMFVLPPNSDGKEVELLEGDGVMRSEALMNGISALKRDPRELFCHFCHVRFSKKTVSMNRNLALDY